MMSDPARRSLGRRQRRMSRQKLARLISDPPTVPIFLAALVMNPRRPQAPARLVLKSQLSHQ